MNAEFAFAAISLKLLLVKGTLSIVPPFSPLQGGKKTGAEAERISLLGYACACKPLGLHIPPRETAGFPTPSSFESLLNPMSVKKLPKGSIFSEAEAERFELSRACALHAFQACALDHYATPPMHSKIHCKGIKRKACDIITRMNDIYEFTVPVFIKTLGGLKNVLNKAEAFAKEKGIPEEAFLKEALAPDMFPLVRQVQIATDNAKGASARLAGLPVPSYEDTEMSFGELYARIDKTIAFLQTITKDMFEGAPSRTISLGYWKGKTMPGATYVYEYALPNFFFHVTTAYGIVRHLGAPIGKNDYINGLSLEGMETEVE